MSGDILPPMIEAALAAGAAIEAIYGAGCAIEYKSDGSPVTVADREAERIILAALAAAFPGVPVLAEESADMVDPATLGARFFLVDPLDGTRGFAERTGEFTVNIALIERCAPVAGVVYGPDSGALYYGAASAGAFRRLRGRETQPIAARRGVPGALAAIGSRHHRSAGEAARLAALGVTGHVAAGSSMKFCVLAEGGADVYPRWGRTMEWDTAAGHAILAAAGGSVLALDADGREAGPLTYGKAARGFDNPDFIAWGVR